MLDIVILAAGAGTRLHSATPKVLHCIADKPLLAHVLTTAHQLKPKQIHVVYGFGGDAVRAAIQDETIQWVVQDKQLGTGHAVAQASPQCTSDRVLILYGDVPLIQVATLQTFLNHVPFNAVGILTADVTNPTGLGRIIRDEQGSVTRIVEERDATEQEKALCEINSGILVFPRVLLTSYLQNLSNNNAQAEYYLTDCIQMAVQSGVKVVGHAVENEIDVLGVNDRIQLAQCERHYQLRQVQALMKQGVTMLDPNRVDIRGIVECGQDVTLDVNVVLTGQIKIGRGSVIEPNCLLKNVVIGEDCIIKANSVLEEVVIGNEVSIGPFARVRPGTKIANKVSIGNFVEIKKSDIGIGTKIPHLSYIGDATIGTKVNIGAGTITCNYDGAHKHQTIIEDDVFVGSDTQLVAPVTLGAGSTIGAGTTVTKNTPPSTLTLSRTAQRTIDNWKRPKKTE